MISIFEVALCLSFLQSGHQNSEHWVWVGTMYPKCTQGYTSVGHCLDRWVAKIKIGKANHLEMTNTWFLFFELPYVAVFCNLAAKTMRTRLGMPLAMPCAQGSWVAK